MSNQIGFDSERFDPKPLHRAKEEFQRVRDYYTDALNALGDPVIDHPRGELDPMVRNLCAKTRETTEALFDGYESLTGGDATRLNGVRSLFLDVEADNTSASRTRH